MPNKTAENTKNAIKQRGQRAAATQKTPAQDQGLKGLVYKMKSRIEGALNNTACDPNRFTQAILTIISSDEKMQAATPQSFLGAMMSAAQLGLEPGNELGFAYLIPYWNSRKRAYEIQFQIGYKGMIALAYRNEQIESIEAETVYENDHFEYARGWEKKLEHVPAMSDRGKPIGYYALFRLKGGGGDFCFMSREDVENHARKFSQSYKSSRPSGPWVDDFDSMAKKTALKQLLKYAPIKVEVTQAINSDEGIKNIDLNNDDQINNPLAVEAEFEFADEPAQEAEVVIDEQTGEVKEQQQAQDDQDAAKSERDKAIEELQDKMGQEKMF